MQGGIQLGEDVTGIGSSRHGKTRPLEAELVVSMEIVSRSEQRHHPRETLGAKPQQLLVPADFAVVGRIAARSLADREVILDDPTEVPRDDPGRPSSPHAATSPNS